MAQVCSVADRFLMRSMRSRSTWISNVKEAVWQVVQPASLLASSSPLQQVRTGPGGPDWLPVWPVAASCQRPCDAWAGRILETSGGSCRKSGCLQSFGQKSAVDTEPLLFFLRAGSGWGKDLDVVGSLLILCKCCCCFFLHPRTEVMWWASLCFAF